MEVESFITRQGFLCVDGNTNPFNWFPEIQVYVRFNKTHHFSINVPPEVILLFIFVTFLFTRRTYCCFFPESFGVMTSFNTYVRVKDSTTVLVLCVQYSCTITNNVQ